MRVSEEQLETMCEAFSEERSHPCRWDVLGEGSKRVVRAGMRAALATLPEPQTGTCPPREELAHALREAYWLNTSDGIDWPIIADRALQLCAARLPAEVWGLVAEWRGLADLDQFVVGGDLLEMCAKQLEAALRATGQEAPKPAVRAYVDESTATWLCQEYARQLDAHDGLMAPAMLAALRKTESAEDDVREALQSAQDEILALEARIRELVAAPKPAEPTPHLTTEAASRVLSGLTGGDSVLFPAEALASAVNAELGAVPRELPSAYDLARLVWEELPDGQGPSFDTVKSLMSRALVHLREHAAPAGGDALPGCCDITHDKAWAAGESRSRQRIADLEREVAALRVRAQNAEEHLQNGRWCWDEQARRYVAQIKGLEKRARRAEDQAGKARCERDESLAEAERLRGLLADADGFATRLANQLSDDTAGPDALAVLRRLEERWTIEGDYAPDGDDDKRHPVERRIEAMAAMHAADVTKLETAAREATRKADDHRRQRDEARRQRDEVQATAESWHDEALKRGARIEELEHELACERDRTRVTAGKLTRADEYIASLEEHRDELRDKIDALEARIADEKGRADRASKNECALDGQLGGLRGRVAELEAQLAARPEPIVVDEALARDLVTRLLSGMPRWELAADHWPFVHRTLRSVLGERCSVAAPQHDALTPTYQELHEALDRIANDGHRDHRVIFVHHAADAAVGRLRSLLEDANIRATEASCAKDAKSFERDQLRAELADCQARLRGTVELANERSTDKARVEHELLEVREQLRAATAQGIAQSEQHEALRCGVDTLCNDLIDAVGAESNEPDGLYERGHESGYGKAARSIVVELRALLQSATQEPQPYAKQRLESLGKAVDDATATALAESQIVLGPPPATSPLSDLHAETDRLVQRVADEQPIAKILADVGALWARFHVLREFVLNASHGDTIAGAKAALDRFDALEREALDARKAQVGS